MNYSHVEAIDWSRTSPQEAAAIINFVRRAGNAESEVRMAGIHLRTDLWRAFDEVDFTVWSIFPGHTRKWH